MHTTGRIKIHEPIKVEIIKIGKFLKVGPHYVEVRTTDQHGSWNERLYPGDTLTLNIDVELV